MEGKRRECKAKLSNVVRKAGEKGRILMGLGKSLDGDKVNLLQDAPTSLSESEDVCGKSDARKIPCGTKVLRPSAPEAEDLIPWNFVDQKEDFSDKCHIRLSGRKASDDWSSEGVRGSESEIRRWSNNDVISSETEKLLTSVPCDRLERFSTMPKLRKKKKTFVPGSLNVDCSFDENFLLIIQIQIQSFQWVVFSVTLLKTSTKIGELTCSFA